MKNLKDAFTKLTKTIKDAKGKENAEHRLLESINQKDDLLKSLDSKEDQIVKKKQKLDDYMIAKEEFLERLNNIQKMMQASLDLNLENKLTEELKTSNESIQKLTTEVLEMKPALERLFEDTSLLLEGAAPDEKPAISIKDTLAEVKKRYDGTLESLITTRGGTYLCSIKHILHVVLDSLVCYGFNCYVADQCTKIDTVILSICIK